MRSIGDLYETCRDLGVVTNQRTFSTLWGKRPSWFSSSQTRQRVPSTEALVTFFIRLERIAYSTREEMVRANDKEDIEALMGGLDEVERMRAEMWNEIMARAEHSGRKAMA